MPRLDSLVKECYWVISHVLMRCSELAIRKNVFVMSDVVLMPTAQKMHGMIRHDQLV